jgi:hypothetical protein
MEEPTTYQPHGFSQKEKSLFDTFTGLAQKAKGIVVESLERFNQRMAEWKEVLVEDRHRA